MKVGYDVIRYPLHVQYGVPVCDPSDIGKVPEQRKGEDKSEKDRDSRQTRSLQTFSSVSPLRHYESGTLCRQHPLHKSGVGLKSWPRSRHINRIEAGGGASKTSILSMA